jgi:hypothetical protein
VSHVADKLIKWSLVVKSLGLGSPGGLQKLGQRDGVCDVDPKHERIER